MPFNIEIKARCPHPARIRHLLHAHHADFKGIDHQTDTYFNVLEGRLKLRQGNIENNLIHYRRTDSAEPKKSEVTLCPVEPGSPLSDLLAAALGVRVVVEKRREIFFIENVKFHLDEVAGLGSFLEIEAIDSTGSIGQASLEEQCRFYMNLFGVREDDLLESSYSDLMLHG